MKRYFNVTGACYPQEHYMVKLDYRLEQIKRLVEQGKYITINRARQYGKTTTLWALKEFLQDDYVVVLLNFQKMSASVYENEETFAKAFAEAFIKAVKNKKVPVRGVDDAAIEDLEQCAKQDDFNLFVLFNKLVTVCEQADNAIVLMIDEVDSASNNQVFLDFLSQLRDMYDSRRMEGAFQSVILAGVYDIKNLKRRFRPDEEHRLNSPWNIATSLETDLGFTVNDIKGMLKEYEDENVTGMDVDNIASVIYDYTSGYPFMVSRICKLMDEQLIEKEEFQDNKNIWTEKGVKAAVKELLKEANTLFDDMCKKIADNQKLKQMLYAMLFQGKSFPYNLDHAVIDIGRMFGFIKEQDGNAVIANRIYETRLYNWFLSEEMVNSSTYEAALLDKNQFVQNGVLDMELVLKKFVEHFADVYTENDEKFIEENGRRLFLLYIKPIINGTGNYYIEARTRDMQRTDVVIDYHGKQYVVELKIWRGNTYHERGEKQLINYLDAYHLDKGYMLSFNFNKNKQVGVREIIIGDKVLVEAVV